MTEIIVAVITGGLALLGVIVSNISANHKIASQLQTSQAVMETKLSDLTREVRTHNDFARRVPVIEEQIKVANHRISNLESESRRKDGAK